jgi:UDP-3-O-[3-hydroxymyristoyl] N-acetylglucosamine deacetylase
VYNYQCTLNNPVSCFGIGLHTGLTISMTLLPAAADTGILFRRKDLAGHPTVKADYRFVSNTMLGTTVSNEDGVKVGTIEHLMAALWGCNIDNVIVELDGPEIPIMDGSSEPFVFLIECAGVAEQNKTRKIIEVLKKVDIAEGDSYASIDPAEGFSVSLEIDFNDEVISRQTCMFDSRDFSFKTDLCRARTFGFAHEVDKLRSMGLGRGGSLDNAIIVSGNKVLNEGGLRYKDEFVRHKVLDCIGDFYLAGAHVKGHFHGFRSGHALNNQLLRKFFADKDAWRILQLPETKNIPFQQDVIYN